MSVELAFSRDQTFRNSDVDTKRFSHEALLRDPRPRMYLEALRQHDEETYNHSVRVARGSGELARARLMTPEQEQMIIWAGLIHDTGKTYIPRKILTKDGPPTSTERAVIKTHPAIVYHNFKDFAGPIAEIAGGHHFDQKDSYGYLGGDLVSDPWILKARELIALMDKGDAGMSERSYKTHWSAKKTARVIKEDNIFDPKLVDLAVEIRANLDLTIPPVARIESLFTDRLQWG